MKKGANFCRSVRNHGIGAFLIVEASAEDYLFTSLGLVIGVNSAFSIFVETSSIDGFCFITAHACGAYHSSK